MATIKLLFNSSPLKLLTIAIGSVIFSTILLRTLLSSMENSPILFNTKPNAIINKKPQALSPEKLGEMVYEIVVLTIPALLNPKLTASWEKGLNQVAQGVTTKEEYL